MVHPSLRNRPVPGDVQRTIAANVRAGMQLRGWTQQDLAMYTGFSATHLSRLLNGNAVWWFRDMRRVAKVFGIDQVELLRPVVEEGAA